MNINLYRLFFFLGLLNLPGALGLNFLNFGLPFLYLILFVLAITSNEVSLLNKENIKKISPILIFLILLLISLFRANEISLTKILNFITFQLFLLAYISKIFTNAIELKLKFIDAFRNYIINPFVFYFILNFVLWIFNITSDAKSDNEIFIGQGVLLAKIGFYIERVNFLFSTGINSYAVMLGAILSYITIDNFYQKRWNLINLILLFLVFVCVLLTDSRSAIIYPFLFLALTLIIKVFNLKFLITFNPLIFILVPILIAIVLPILAEVPFFSQFSRNDSDLFTLNGRLFIWIFAMEEFINFKFIHLIGYGFEGHVTSGASLNWAFLFTAYNESDNVHPHNSIFSMIFDIGYIGIALILYIFYRIGNIIVVIWKKNKNTALTYYSLLIFFIFISVTESFIGLYYLNTMNLIISFFIYIFGVNIFKEMKND